jgi:hypothetical protein
MEFILLGIKANRNMTKAKFTLTNLDRISDEMRKSFNDFRYMNFKSVEKLSEVQEMHNTK